MKLTIDNLQGQGPQDYTGQLDGTQLPRVERKLNQPAELQFSLVANSPGFVIPVVGARVYLPRNMNIWDGASKDRCIATMSRRKATKSY